MASDPDYLALLSAIRDSDTASARWAKRQEQNRLRDLRYARRSSAVARNLLNDFVEAKEEKLAELAGPVFGIGGPPPPPMFGGGGPPSPRIMHIPPPHMFGGGGPPPGPLRFGGGGPPPPPSPARVGPLVAVPNQVERYRPHPYWQVIPRVRNTIRAFSVAKGVYDLGKLYKHGFANEKGDSVLRDSRVRLAREDRLAGRITQNEARKRIDDANLRHAGSSAYRVAARLPGIALGALTRSYDPISAAVDIATVAPNAYSTISSGLKYAGSKMGFDPADLPDHKAYFDASARRFQTGAPYGVLSGHVAVSGHQPRFVKCRGGIC